MSLASDIVVTKEEVVGDVDPWRVSITFKTSGVGHLSVDGYLFSENFQVKQNISVGALWAPGKLEFSNFENDFGYYFENEDPREYFHVWLQMISQNRKMSSERETYPNDQGAESTLRSVNKSGLEVSFAVSERQVDMLNAIASCKYIRWNGVDYNPQGSVQEEPIEQHSGLYRATLTLQRVASITEVTVTEIWGESGEVAADDYSQVLNTQY
ncbi:MAG: hypothetical protein DRH97_07855 [Chloroflexi bacterium]|nr:MAG: hypothetical protein DRH97_07855 [Chloroflexota bacterium]